MTTSTSSTPSLAEWLATDPTAALAEIDRLRARRNLWRPLPGPQSLALNSRATIVGYGGAAGGGKTDLAIGAAVTRHRKAIIFRREYPQLRDIVSRGRDLLDESPVGWKYNANETTFRFEDGRTLELGAVQLADDWRKYKGRAHDYVAFDEATEFQESQVRALLAWLRTTEPGQRVRAVLTFNPPTSQEGMWVIRFFAPWLDPEHPNPAAPGELRWFAMVDGQEREVPDGSPFEHVGPTGEAETIRPMSRTFIPARLSDNPYLLATDYGTVLQSLPEPLRSQLLRGDFAAGMESDPWQVIPTAWVQQAQRRWREWSPDGRPPDGFEPACSGLDVAHGGKDKTVTAVRYAAVGAARCWVAPPVKVPGADTPDGKAAASAFLRAWPGQGRANIDAIGYGASAAERLRDAPPMGHGIATAAAVNVAEKSEFRDRSGKFGMRNLRAEMYWRLREALDPDGPILMALPPDPELLADLCQPRFEIQTTGIKIEDKADVAGRLGRSPDVGDAVALTMLDMTPPPPPSKVPVRARDPLARYRG
jgi:hypothetical protein